MALRNATPDSSRRRPAAAPPRLRRGKNGARPGRGKEGKRPGRPTGTVSGTPAAAAFDATLAALRQRHSACARQFLETGGAEPVHGLRVAGRRLRAALGAYRKLPKKGPARRLARELKWLHGRFGTVRDLDVFRTETLAPLIAAHGSGPQAGALAALAAEAEAARAAAAKQAARPLETKRYARLAATLADWAAGGWPRRSRDAWAGKPVDAVAARSLDRDLPARPACGPGGAGGPGRPAPAPDRRQEAALCRSVLCHNFSASGGRKLSRRADAAPGCLGRRPGCRRRDGARPSPGPQEGRRPAADGGSAGGGGRGAPGDEVGQARRAPDGRARHGPAVLDLAGRGKVRSLNDRVLRDAFGPSVAGPESDRP